VDEVAGGVGRRACLLVWEVGGSFGWRGVGRRVSVLVRML
jgi:hypothetical protein